MSNPIKFDLDELEKELDAQERQENSQLFDIDELEREMDMQETEGLVYNPSQRWGNPTPTSSPADYPFTSGIKPTKVEKPYATISEQIAEQMTPVTPEAIAEQLPKYKSALDIEEGRKKNFEENFTTNPEYRAKWFQENVGMTEEEFKASQQAQFAQRFESLLPRAEAIFKKNMEDNAKQRGGTGLIRTIENLGSSMAAKSKLDELRGISASLKNNDVWSGMYEGVDLLDVMSGGLADFASEKAYNEALKKQANGEELTEEEQFAIDASDLYDDINETFEVLGGRSGWNKVGRTTGQSAEFMAGMLPTSGLGFSTSLMKGLGLKVGWRSVKNAASNGLRAALGESLKQGGKVLGRGLYNLGLSYAESIPRAAIMPGTYSRYLELRNERLKNGESLEGNWLQDAGRAGIEMTNEIASEIWGSTFIHDSFRAMGKGLGIDKAMDAIGLGRRRRTMFGWTPSASTREMMRRVGYSGDYLSEVTSELAGDVATNLAMGVLFNDAQWGEMATKEYWTTLLGATALQGAAMQSLNTLANIPEYKRLNSIQQKRDKAVNDIQSEQLRKDIEMAFTYDDAAEMGKALAAIDWNAYNRIDVANAMDAVRLEVPLRIATGERAESERVAKFAPHLQETLSQAYQGVDANNPLPQAIIVDAVTDEGANVRIMSGDYHNPDAMLNVVDMNTGKSMPILASKVMNINEVSIQQRVQEDYRLMFSTEENVERLGRVMQTLDNFAYYNAMTSADAIDIVERAGFTVYGVGSIVTLVDGQQVEIAAPMMSDGHYLVRDANGNASVVGLLDVLQPAMEVVEAQVQIAREQERQDTAEATEAVEKAVAEAMPQSPMPEGVAYGEAWVTPQGIGRVVEYNAETGKVYMDINLSSPVKSDIENEEIIEVDVTDLQRKPSEAEMTEARNRSVRRNALMINDETSSPLGAIQEQVEQPAMEVGEVEADQPTTSVPSMEDVPTTADGIVDYDAITDADMYARLLTQDLGSKEEALEAVNTSIEGYTAEVSELQEKAKKEKNMTQRVALTKQAAAVQQHLDVLNQVRDILTPQEAQNIEVEQIAGTPQVEETQQEHIGLMQDDFTATLPNGEAELIDSLARSLGLSVEFVDKVNEGNSNAQILGNKVLIAKKNRDKAIKFLVGHEFTHRMQDLSPEAYAEFKAAVKEYMGEEMYNTLLQKEIAKYRQHNIYRTQEQLEDEVIADFAGSLVYETDVLDTFIEPHADKKSMWQAILDVLRAIREWILKDTAYDTAEARALQNTIGTLEALFQSASEKVAEGVTAQNTEARNSEKDINTLTEEEQDIIATAKTNGTYLKAPNGADTNLTPHQWVQVRTKAFKDWFGDWELAAIAEYIMNDDVVAILNGDEFAKDGTPLTDKVVKYYADNHNGKVERDGLGEVLLDKRSVKDSASHGLSKAKSAAFAAVPNIITEGRIIDSQTNWKSRGYDSVTIAAPIRIGDENYVGVVVVKKSKEFNRFYLHEVMIQKSLRDGVFQTSLNTGNPSGDIAKVIKNIINANNSSKIVDANGEPKVAEHSTWNEDFYTFDINRLGESSGDEGVYGAGFYFGNVGETELYGDRAIQAYLNMRKPLVLPDAPIRGFFDYLVENFDKEGLRDIVVKQGNKATTMGEVVDAIKAVNEAHARGEYAELIEQMSQYWYPAEDRVLEQQIFRKIGLAIYPTLEPFIQYNVGRKEFSDALRNAGYDGVVYDNQEYVAFEPNQIKSADPVTYDDAGNIIPLSERFKLEKADVRYSVKDIPSLVGVHNISLEKLRKVIKMGALANPSVAVIDADKQTHEDYGEYSLILPKNMVDARQGKNAGTWAGDAWTPTYPQITKRMSKDKDISRYYKDTDVLPEAMRNRVRLDFDSFMDGRSANALAYWYLFDKGVAPELVDVPARYPVEIVDALNEATNGSFSMFGLSAEERARCLDAFIAYKYKGDRATYDADMAARKERLENFAKNHDKGIVRKKAQEDLDAINEYGFDYDEVSRFIRDVEWDVRHKGETDIDATIKASMDYIAENNLGAEYDAWRNSLDERYGIEEYIFDGYTNSGTRRYLPHTVENASKWMKKQGRQGAVATFPSFGIFVAVSIPKMTTLESIRKRKNLLGKSKEEYDAFREKWENVYFELGKKLQPDAKGFDDYGYWRLIEAVEQKNPKEFIKKQYNIELSAEDVNTLNDMLDAIRTEYPARYFETKFERPLQLNDFVAAVVPDDVPMDVWGRLNDANVKIFEYEKGNSNSRAEAMQKATATEGVRFSVKDNQKADEIAYKTRKIGRVYGVNTPMVIAVTPEDYRREVLNTGVKEKDFDPDTSGVYLDGVGYTVINSAVIKDDEELVETIIHEGSHRLTHDDEYWQNIADVVASIDSDRLERFSIDILGKIMSPMNVADEIIATFVGQSAIIKDGNGLYLLRGFINGGISIDEVISTLRGKYSQKIKDNYADIVDAMLPFIRTNIETIKTQSNDEGRINGGDVLISGRGYRPSVEETTGDRGLGYRGVQSPSIGEDVRRSQEVSNLEAPEQFARQSVKDNVSDEVAERLERIHQDKIARINRFYDDRIILVERRAAEMARQTNGTYKRSWSNAQKIDFLFPDGVTAAPIADQVLADIARGQKLRWNDSPDGRKRGLSTELGLDSARAEGMGAVTNGATTYVEDYIEQLYEANNGYERGLDDQDIRNAVLDMFSRYPSPKAALQELEDTYINAAENESAEEALRHIDIERENALREENRRYAEDLARYAENPQLVRDDFFASDMQAEFIKEESNAVYAIERKVRTLQKRLDNLRSKQRVSRAEQKQIIDEIKQEIRKALNPRNARYFNSVKLRSLINTIDASYTIKGMARAMDRVLSTFFDVNYRLEKERRDALTKSKINFNTDSKSVESYLEGEVAAGHISKGTMERILADRWRGVNSRGVSVAKYIDGDTAIVMDFIAQNIKWDESKEPSAQRYELVDKAIDMGKEKNYSHDLIGDLINAAYILEDYWLAEQMLKVSESYSAELEQANKELTEIETEMLASTSLDAEQRDEIIGGLQVALEEALRRKQALHDQHFADMPNIIAAMNRANNSVAAILSTGRVKLSQERYERKKHEAEIVQDALDDLTNYGNPEEIAALDKALGISGINRQESWLEKAKQRMWDDYIWSLDYMLRSFGRFAPDGTGRVYMRFMPALNAAWSDYRKNLSEIQKRIDEKIRSLWGDKSKSWKRGIGHNPFNVMSEKAEEKHIATITYTKAAIAWNTSTTEGGVVEISREKGAVTETMDLSLSQAMYLLASWGQSDGRMKLEANGIKEEHIAEVRMAMQRYDERYLDFMDWVIADLLPSLRERYNEVHRQLFGTYMTSVDNYFPLKVTDKGRYIAEDVSQEKGDKAPLSINPGAIINRTHNTNMIDLKQNFFKVLAENISEMERWATMMPVAADINALMSNGTVRNYTKAAFGPSFHTQLRDRFAVATGQGIRSPKLGMESTINTAMRYWASTKIGFRFFTAFKQIASLPAILTYSMSPDFLAEVGVNLTKGISTLGVYPFRYCIDKFPMFRERVANLRAGDITLMKAIEEGSTQVAEQYKGAFKTIKTTGKMLDAFAQYLGKAGFAANMWVDALSSGIIAMSVYNYEYKRLQKQGYTAEQADKMAIFLAENAFNQTQQSAEYAYLAPGQLSPRMFDKAITVFQNSTFLYTRQGVQGLHEVKKSLLKSEKMRDNIQRREARRLHDLYISQGLSEEEAQAKAAQEARRIATQEWKKVAIHGAGGVAWGLFLGNYIFSVIGNLFAYCNFWDDDDERNRLLWEDVKWNLLFSPVRGFPGGGSVMGFIQYGRFEPFGAMSEFSEDIAEIYKMLNKVGEDGFNEQIAWLILEYAGRWGIGVDANTVTNLYKGIESMVESGMSTEAIMQFLNAPQSQMRLIADKRREGETFKQYLDRVRRVQTKYEVDMSKVPYYTDMGAFIGSDESQRMTEKQEKVLRTVYRQYEEAYRKDVLQRTRPEMNKDWADTEEQYKKVAKNLGWKPNKNPNDDRAFNEAGDYIGRMPRDVYEQLYFLQGEVAYHTREAARFLGNESDYAKYLDSIYMNRKQLIQLYDDNSTK